MSAPVFLLALSILLAFGVFVIRILMRREYERRGALSKPGSFLFTAVFFGIGFFIWFDLLAGTPPPLLGETAWRIGWVLFAVGLAGMLGMMIWLGIRRSFGVQTKGLNQSGPYRYSRNPQTVVCSLIMISFALLDSLPPSDSALNGGPGFWSPGSHTGLFGTETSGSPEFPSDPLDTCPALTRPRRDRNTRPYGAFGVAFRS